LGAELSLKELMMFLLKARRSLLVAALAAAPLMAALPNMALAFEKDSTSSVNVDKQSVAVKGYDVVAYFTAATPTKGDPAYKATHAGANYLFANQANLDAFKAAPDKYAPQYGGFCAMGVALNKKLDGDPTAWRVVDGKLYLNLNKDVQSKWSQDVSGNLSKANSVWPGIKDKAPSGL
jgi:YHS domain-containing protein